MTILWPHFRWASVARSRTQQNGAPQSNQTMRNPTHLFEHHSALALSLEHGLADQSVESFLNSSSVAVGVMACDLGMHADPHPHLRMVRQAAKI